MKAIASILCLASLLPLSVIAAAGLHPVAAVHGQSLLSSAPVQVNPPGQIVFPVRIDGRRRFSPRAATGQDAPARFAYGARGACRRGHRDTATALGQLGQPAGGSDREARRAHADLLDADHEASRWHSRNGGVRTGTDRRGLPASPSGD